MASMIAAAAMAALLILGCATTPTPQPSANPTMRDWRECVARGMENAEYGFEWNSKKEAVWFQCLTYIPEGQVEAAAGIMNLRIDR